MLKPEWTNIFQELADHIENYENPELSKELDKLWPPILQAIKQGSEVAIQDIIALIEDYTKNHL